MLRTQKHPKYEFWGLLRIHTLGQAVYLAVIASIDGLNTVELVAKLQDHKPDISLDAIMEAVETLHQHGHVRRDEGRWYAPGPTPAIWESL